VATTTVAINNNNIQLFDATNSCTVKNLDHIILLFVWRYLYEYYYYYYTCIICTAVRVHTIILLIVPILFKCILQSGQYIIRAIHYICSFARAFTMIFVTRGILTVITLYYYSNYYYNVCVYIVLGI